MTCALCVMVGTHGSPEVVAAGNEKPKPLMAHARLLTISSQSEAVTSAMHEARMRERADLLQRGESALASNNVAAALQAFERAAMILHAPDTEMGLVRTYMQGGEYRRALAFGAHTAGAHLDVAGGTLLYAWLLHIGGQGAHAQRLLNEMQVRLPADPLVSAVRRELQSATPLATGRLLEAPSRLAPYGPSSGLPATARVAGTGVLIDSGRRVLIPITTLPRSTRVWVRNGLGQLMKARVEKRLVASRVAVLRLEQALPVASDLAVAASDAFPGSIGFTVEYVTSHDPNPRWPVMSSGFLGRPDGTQRLLGIDLSAGPRGGPVFDAGGCFIGIALPGAKGPDQLLLISHLSEIIGDVFGPPASASAGTRVPADRIYESALRTTVQIIAAH